MKLARKLSSGFLRSGSWIVAVLLTLLSPASLPAMFEGFGSSTPGGNNGTVVEVTSLADSGTGTLRAALSSGNRRIVFRVGGTITLQSTLEIRSKSFITIDGSTAPAPGITLKGRALYIRNSHDIIVTHIRIRDSIEDGITLWDGSSNVVIDHCSVTNSGDGNIDITENTSNVTVSWCIIGDTRSDSFARKTKGMLIANFTKPPVTNVSLHHNLFVNEFQRSPQISTAGLFDVRNNVIQDWGSYGIRMRNGAWGNIINNVFATDNNAEDAVVLEADAGPVYIQGNLGPGARNVNALTTAAAEFAVAPVSTDPATEVVEQEVLQGAGTFPRDAIDTSLAGSSSQSPSSQSPASLSVSPTSIAAGGILTATWSGIATPTTTDWLGLYVPGAPSTGYIDWIWVSCSKTPGSARPAGSCPFVVPTSVAPGTYELRLFANQSYTRLATSNAFTVTAVTGTNLSVTPTSIGAGGTLTATWSGIATPTTTDWLGLYVPGAPSTGYIDWIWVSCSKTPGSARPAGSCPFVVPTSVAPGTYELRLFANQSYTRLATGNAFTVASQ